MYQPFDPPELPIDFPPGLPPMPPVPGIPPIPVGDGPAQLTRFLGVYTSLGMDVFLLTAVDGFEQLSRPFEFQLEMCSRRLDINPTAMIGTPISFRIGLLCNKPRYFNGFISEFRAAEIKGDYRIYHAKVVPWIWFLGRTRDCRIFQDVTIVEAVEQIFQDPEHELIAKYSFNGVESPGEHKRDCLVQYRESDFNFVSRRLEEDGIFYYFTHDVNPAAGTGTHEMVMANDAHSPEYCDDKRVEFRPDGRHHTLSCAVFEWASEAEFISNRVARRDYNHHMPHNTLDVHENSIYDVAPPGCNGGSADECHLELYDYPGIYETKPDGRRLARIRMQEEEVRYHRFRGQSNCRSFFAGGQFILEGFETSGWNPIEPPERERTYLLTRVTHQAREPVAFRSNSEGREAKTYEYTNSFQCIPADVVFRPPRITRIPAIHGTQTAFVVGPNGSEIYTEVGGRVKVQFHWDRRGERDEKSSCWIRVAQSWAGQKWGAHFWPRVGHEVVVIFLEGDVDRPLIVASVYNDDHVPPYELPLRQNASGIKSNSTPDGDGYNELRFYDHKECEQLLIHAERRMDQYVRASLYETNFGNREIRVGCEDCGDLNRYVWHDVNQITCENHYYKVEKDVHRIVEGEVFEKHDKSHKTHIGKTLMVTAEDAITEASGTISDKAAQIRIEGTQNVSVSGGAVNIEACTEITLRVLGSYINIYPDRIDISAPRVNINSGGSPKSAQPALTAEDFEIIEPIEALHAITDFPDCCGGGSPREHEVIEAPAHRPPVSPCDDDEMEIPEGEMPEEEPEDPECDDPNCDDPECDDPYHDEPVCEDPDDPGGREPEDPRDGPPSEGGDDRPEEDCGSG